jgi:hypothetical protein
VYIFVKITGLMMLALVVTSPNGQPEAQGFLEPAANIFIVYQRLGSLVQGPGPQTCPVGIIINLTRNEKPIC